MSGFGLIEGEVGTKFTIAKTSGQINVNANSLNTLNLAFVKAADINKILVRADSAANFSIELYSHSTKTWEYFVMSASSDGDQQIHFIDRLSSISPESTLYMNIFNNEGITKTFDVLIHGEIAKSKII